MTALEKEFDKPLSEKIFVFIGVVGPLLATVYAIVQLWQRYVTWTDIALMCVYRQPQLDPILGLDAAWASDRLPDGDAIAEAYARRRGLDLAHWPFYLALANFKLAVIAQGISYRARQGAIGLPASLQKVFA